MNNLQARAFRHVLLGAVLWGTTGTAQALAPDSADPVSVGTVRIAVGGLSLLVVALIRGSFRRGGSWPITAILPAAICVSAYQLFFFSAVNRTGIAVGTLVTIGSAPVIAGLLAQFFYKEKPAFNWYTATGLATAGCVLLVSPGNDARADAAGIILALCAGLSFAGYALVGKRLLVEHPLDAALAVVFSVGGIILAPLLLVYKPYWLLEPAGILVALHLGVIATALAYVLFTGGLALMPVASAVTLTLAEPLTATMLGIFLIGERLSLLNLAGAALVLAALFILSGKRNPGRVRSRSPAG